MKTLATLLSAALTAGLASAAPVTIAAKISGQGYQQTAVLVAAADAKDMEGKCAEGKCGEGMCGGSAAAPTAAAPAAAASEAAPADATTPAKDQEGKCGAEHQKDKDGSCGAAS